MPESSVEYQKRFSDNQIDVKSSKSVPHQRLDPVFPKTEHKSTPQKLNFHGYQQQVQHMQHHPHYIQPGYHTKSPSFHPGHSYPPQYHHQAHIQPTHGGYYPQIHNNIHPNYSYHHSGPFQQNYSHYSLNQPTFNHHPEAHSVPALHKQGSFSAKNVNYVQQKLTPPEYSAFGQNLPHSSQELLRIPPGKATPSGIKQKNISSSMLYSKELGLQGVNSLNLADPRQDGSASISSPVNSPLMKKQGSSKEEKKGAKTSTTK